MSFAEFLGVGLVTPFRRDEKNDFANDNGLALVKSCVDQILGTRLGELEWRGDFGSEISRMLHRKGKILDELARVYVVDALAKWEPRVQIATVRTMFDPQSRLFVLRLRYNVIDRNVPGNAVIFSNVDQDVLLPIGIDNAA